MQKLMTIGIALVLAIGCGKSADDKGKAKDIEDGKADLDALVKLKDEMCACKDAACGKTVEDKLTAKSKEMDKTYADSPNKNIMHHASETEMAAKECLFKLK